MLVVHMFYASLEVSSGSSRQFCCQSGCRRLPGEVPSVVLDRAGTRRGKDLKGPSHLRDV